MAIGKVIKGGDGPVDSTGDSASPARPATRLPRPGGVVNSEVYEAHQSANVIIENAKKQAQEIIEAAQAEAEGIRAEWQEKGRQEGLAQVTEQHLRAKMLRTQILQQSEQEIVQLALKVAEKVLGRDLERDPELVIDLCANAIEQVRTAQELVIRVNPRDAAILRSGRVRLMELIGRIKEIAIKEDRDVPSTGCIIETDTGTIDAQLSTQLEMIRNVLIVDPGKKEGPA